jgi:deoxycytidylate deaminase
MKKLICSVFFAALIAASTTQAAPVLNSFPTATATLYLDFDGHDVNSSMWNYGTPFTCLPAAMTDLQITEAFNRVSEDYRPFNINVTTDLNKFLAAPLSMRVRIVVTPTSAWYAGVAGIAYVGSFTWGDDTPAFVFSDKLSNDAKRVAEAIAHESGHTLGLYHQSSYTTDCALSYTYNPGNGIGETSWGPIMGSAASKNTTQWNYGPTPNGCTILQDNLSIITTNNGFGYRTDDYADTYSSAIAISITANIFNKTGLISTTNDKDNFRFDLGQNGQFKLKVLPYSVGANNSGANLDVRITLQNANGVIITTYDYKDSLHAEMDTILNAGTYYVVIDGAGNINSTNDYGSLGAYTMDGYYSGTTTTSTTTTTTTTKGKTTTSTGTTGGKRRETNASFTNITATDEVVDGKIFNVIKQVQQPVMVNATEAYEYQVFDNYGRTIMVGKAAAGTKIIDIRNQPAGIYNLRLMNPNEQRVEKFMNK